MKKHLLATLALALSLAAVAQRTTVNATFSGLADGVSIIHAEPQANRLVPVDTLRPDSKGRVKFERYSHQPEFLFLKLSSDKSPVLHLLLLPKEKVSLEVVYMPTVNSFDITAVKGSDNMALYKDFSNLVAQAQLQQQPAIAEDGVATLLEAHPDLLFSAFLVTFYEQAFEQYAPLYKKIRDALTPTYADHEFVKFLDSKLRSLLIAGMEAPDIVMEGTDGKELRLSDLRGKVVLIDFWASWCGPCRRENPHVVSLYHRFHDKGFEIFSVSLDNNRDAWLKAIKDDGLVWPYHVSDLRGWQSAAGRLYGINSVPATVLVDRQGNILARNLRGQDLDNKLNEIFAQ